MFVGYMAGSLPYISLLRLGRVCFCFCDFGLCGSPVHKLVICSCRPFNHIFWPGDVINTGSRRLTDQNLILFFVGEQLAESK